ncbi:MAG: alpha/beta fold hydrolase [Sedimentitalea sp.]
MIAAIYESVIRPELYDALMDAWGAHMQDAVADIDTERASLGENEALGIDPGLQAHFARAYEILEQIGRKAPQSSLVERVQDMHGFAVLCTSAGQVLAAGAAAQPVAEIGAGLAWLEQDLVANSAELLGELMHTVQRGDDTAAPIVLSTDGDLPRHLMARVAQSADETGTARPMLMIEALDYQWSERAERMLVQSFALSRAELDVVRNLLAGLSLREIAQSSGRSEHTVRNQAKAVLAKTGAPGQVDLVRLVVFLINQDVRTRPVAKIEAPLPDEMRRMRGGRAMQVFRFGPPDGQPVIFLHGMLDSVSPLRFLQADCLRHGWHVLAPMRPGFGRSDRVARPDQALDVFCEHMRELIDSEKLQRPVLLSQMGGALYGRVIASRLAGRVAGLVAVAGNVPIARLSQLSIMAPRQRIVAYTARFAPALLPTILRAGIAQVDSKDIDGFIDALFKPGSHENKVIERLNLAELFREGVRFSVQQGHIGFETDSHYVVRNWAVHMRGPAAPTIQIHGKLDPVVPVDSVIEALNGQPGVELRVQDDAGQLVFYEKPAEICAAIAELAEPQSAKESA